MGITPDLRKNLLSVFFLTRRLSFRVSINNKTIIFRKKGLEALRGTIHASKIAIIDVNTERFLPEFTALAATPSGTVPGTLALHTNPQRFY